MSDDSLELVPEVSEPTEEVGQEPVNEKRRSGQAKAARKRRFTNKLKKADISDAELERLHAVLDEKNAPPAAATPSEAPPPEALVAISNMKSGEVAELLWTSLDTIFLQETRYALNEKKRAILIEATAPVLDKYLPSVANTPEGALVVALAVVFGPPAAKHLLEAKPLERVVPDPDEQKAAA